MSYTINFTQEKSKVIATCKQVPSFRHEIIYDESFEEAEDALSDHISEIQEEGTPIAEPEEDFLYPNSKILMTLSGLPRSGKSTWAKNVRDMYDGVGIVCPDDIRIAMHGSRFNRGCEDLVWATAKLMVKTMFQSGIRLVIFDATSITKEARDKLFYLGQDYSHLAMFDTSEEICIERAKASGQGDLIPIIKSMSKKRDREFEMTMEPDDYKKRKYTRICIATGSDGELLNAN